MGFEARAYFWSPRKDGLQGHQLEFVDFDSARGIATSARRRIVFEPGQGAVRRGSASLTPDGRWLFFEWTESAGDVFVGKLVVR